MDKEHEEDSSGSSEDVPRSKRETFSRKIDFLFACCGFSIGLGNVWKFPFLCYRNGGGAFLIPYFVCCIAGGIPTFLLEVSVGQFMSLGGMNAWKICPLFQGIGVAAAVIVFLVNCDYNVLLSWAFYYFFASLTTVLPWSHCENDYNTNKCTTGKFGDKQPAAVNATNNTLVTLVNEAANLTSVAYNKSVAQIDLKTVGSDPVTEFWERKVLDISDGVGEPGPIKWDLCLCLLLAWIVVYFCIWKGIKGSGKVWADAGNQVFYSYSLSTGILVALGSYNKFHHNAYRDCLIFAGMNTFTSLMSGFVIFSVLGFMAQKQGVSIDKVAESVLELI
ncbi:SC6A8-like protein [Mya arenaria]|uniref:Transporter n=1 Tax=Mya arenaria TaxID=6604 RepID=A0ABY7DWL6_MYAAR|nr:SC6A8-like protein [Mya arenaria]